MALKNLLLASASAMMLAALTAASTAQPAASAKSWPKLHTNQQFIEEAMKKTDLNISDYRDVLEFVLKSLPDTVKVWPTENYYYFYFWHNGIKYAGNLRLDVSERDKGKVNFAYFEDFTPWYINEENNFYLLGEKDGVKVEKKDDLTYTVSFRGRTVTFRLNDLSKVKPPKGILLEDEQYMGPVFDESGVPFYLVFNRRLKVFHFILNEQLPPSDRLLPTRVSSRILLGQRTGFAYYRDKYAPRKILIGIYAGNSMVNNYFDGPFDQLPDNFIPDDRLQKAIYAMAPEMKGQLDRLGNSPGGKTRFLISPYMHYEKLEELKLFDECAESRGMKRETYHACFSVASGPAADGPPPEAEQPYGDQPMDGASPGDQPPPRAAGEPPAPEGNKE